MNEKDILNFRAEIKDFSLEELEKKRTELQDGVCKMILDSDLMIKAAIVETLIKEKKNG